VVVGWVGFVFCPAQVLYWFTGFEEHDEWKQRRRT